MKKFLLLLILYPLLNFDVHGCNVCGCGVGSYHYGILPQFRKNFAGIRYRHSSFTSTLDNSHADPYSVETFQAAELWGRFYPAKRIQTFAFVPFNFNERQEGSGVKRMKGLGDIVISANYNLLNTFDSTRSIIKHNLLLGAGVKLPTGQYRAIENGLTVNQNFQLGTGSLDFLFNLIHTARYKNWGLNTELSYAANTTNNDEYRFGNATRAGVTAFYIISANAITFMPNVGISGEFFKDNTQYEVPFPDTGGWASLYSAGVEVYVRNMALGFSYGNPGKQALFNDMVRAHDRTSVHLTFMF